MVNTMPKLYGVGLNNVTREQLTMDDVVEHVRCLEKHLKENEELQVKMLDIFIDTFQPQERGKE